MNVFEFAMAVGGFLGILEFWPNYNNWGEISNTKVSILMKNIYVAIPP